MVIKLPLACDLHEQSFFSALACTAGCYFLSDPSRSEPYAWRPQHNCSCL